MSFILDLLDGNSSVGVTGSRIPLVWSADYKESLQRLLSVNAGPERSPEQAVAHSFLLCADGRFADAEDAIIGRLRKSTPIPQQDENVFSGFVSELFVSQRFDLVKAALRDRHGFSDDFDLEVRSDGPGLNCVRWEISGSGRSKFIFDAKAFENDNTRVEILAFHWGFPLYANYLRQADRESGLVVINQADTGAQPGLAWCDNRPDRFLVPDCIFVPTHGYRHARQVFKDRHIAWHDRIPIAFWRGASTGIPSSPGEWRSLERIQLCEIARSHQHKGFLDVGISSVVQFDDPAVAHEIQAAGLMRERVPWEEWGRYKYHIDIDGNSSPWSNLFQRLLTGSPVLKVESSRGLLQWYYDRLIPWYNYVPIAPDMSDLIDKIDWLMRNDTSAELIGQRGRELADRLSYEAELERSIPVISSAFRYLAGATDGIGPYGRSSDPKPHPCAASETPIRNPEEIGMPTANDDLLQRYLTEHETYALHLGCGTNIKPGWLNTDIGAASEQVFVMDAGAAFPLPTSTFHYAYTEHMIEHIPYGSGLQMLREIFRILRPGGTLRVVTPSIGFLINLFSRDRTALEDSYLEQQLGNFPEIPAVLPGFWFNIFVRHWGHQFIYDRETLRLALQIAGFAQIEECAILQSKHEILCNLENVSRMPDGFLALESMVFEATKH